MDVDPSGAGATAKDGKVKGNAGAKTKKARSPSPKSKQRQSSASQESTNKKKSSLLQSSEIISDQQALTEPIEEERQRPALQLQQLNTVIFGLPNLTFLP